MKGLAFGLSHMKGPNVNFFILLIPFEIGSRSVEWVIYLSPIKFCNHFRRAPFISLEKHTLPPTPRHIQLAHSKQAHAETRNRAPPNTRRPTLIRTQHTSTTTHRSIELTMKNIHGCRVKRPK